MKFKSAPCLPGQHALASWKSSLCLAVLLACIAISANAADPDQASQVETIESGYLIANGQYVAPPYQFEIGENELTLNDSIALFRIEIPEMKPVEMPEYSEDEIALITSMDELPVNGDGIDLDHQLIRYYSHTEESEEAAVANMLEFYESLPFVTNAKIDPELKSPVVLLETTQGQERIEVFRKPVVRQVEGELRGKQSLLEKALKEGRVVFFFPDSDWTWEASPTTGERLDQLQKAIHERMLTADELKFEFYDAWFGFFGPEKAHCELLIEHFDIPESVIADLRTPDE